MISMLAGHGSAPVETAIGLGHMPVGAREIGWQMHEADEVGLLQRARGAERMIEQRVAEIAAGIGGGADRHAELGEALKDAFDRQRAR